MIDPRTDREISSTGRVKWYADGSAEIMACDAPVFRMVGWERRESTPPPLIGERRDYEPSPYGDGDNPVEDGENSPSESDLMRSMRRARTKVRDLALSNSFKWFVTLTLDQTKVDRYDVKEVTKKLNRWLSNQVTRQGLKYILVPEHHKDGAIHFHGFFSGGLDAVDSGLTDRGGHSIYNLPQWKLGFTTAIELYGDYSQAVGYVCKYIGKAGTDKVGGRWYYSGGALEHPIVERYDMNIRDIASMEGAYLFDVPEAKKSFAVVRLSPAVALALLGKKPEFTFLGLSTEQKNPTAPRAEGLEGWETPQEKIEGFE